MLVFMILEVKQFQGVQVLYVTMGINGRKQRKRSLEMVKQLRDSGVSHHYGL